MKPIVHSTLTTRTSSISSDLIQTDGLIFSQDDSILQLARKAAFENLQSRIQSLATFQGEHNAKLIHNHNNSYSDNSITINSLIFHITSYPDPILVITPSSDRVDTKKLEAYLGKYGADERLSASLVHATAVEQLCGFPPQSIPPLGHIPQSFRTIIDIQLVQQKGIKLIGGGGHPTVSCVISVDTLLLLEGTEVADVCRKKVVLPSQPIQIHQESKGFLDQSFIKPFFPLLPPDVELAKLFLENPDEPNPLQPQPITIVGYINGVRRMARRLAFCDLAPPNFIGTGTQLDSYELPWKSGADGEDMAVQLIAGKTLCKRRGDTDGPELIRTIRPGQLVLVEGRTNVGNRDSLGNWINKRSLDIVVWDYQVLEPILASKNNPTLTHNDVAQSIVRQTKDRSQRTREEIIESSTISSNTKYLKLCDVFDDPKFMVVDNLEQVERFARDLESLLSEQLCQGTNPTSMVGIDCEWKPSFMMSSPSEPQPVLLLQISVQRLQTVYLLDLQTLLRPCLHASVDMNDIESATSKCLSLLLGAPQFLKVGFQLLSDLRRLAGSYPHVEAFGFVRAVLDVAEFTQKAMQLARIRNAKQAVTSLSRLTEYLLDKPIDKEQQISDWSVRPLNAKQLEYAALDAAVAPVLFERSLKLCDVRWLGGGLRLGRWDGDASFIRSISSIRFLFLDDDNGQVAARKLKAKKIVSNQYVVTQSWVEGHEIPNIPSLPSNGGEGPYTDSSGIRRIPSHLVALNPTKNDRTSNGLVGQRLGRSKDSCLEALCSGIIPSGSKLEYPSRSGYVEFEDGVVLFVNMPGRPFDPSPRGYPNVWLDSGKFMTWFLRTEEWNLGTSSIGWKLLQSGVNGESPNRTILFVRTGRGDFLCCGRCRVVNEGASTSKAKDWTLVELRLEILDWQELQNCVEFTSMTCKPGVGKTSEHVFVGDCKLSPALLAEEILIGNIVGALSLALRNYPKSERSIRSGLQRISEILTHADVTSTIELALGKVKEMEENML